MDLGDIVTYAGRRYIVRGIDPVGVHPREVYLENVRTGETVSIAFEQLRLRLVPDERRDSPTTGSPPKGE